MEEFTEILTKRSQTFYKPINVYSVMYAISVSSTKVKYSESLR